jgi:hypothetical protein
MVGFALTGFVWIGPIELFFPTGAYAALGQWAWMLLVALYGLIVLLIALQRSPAWTLVGLDRDELQSVIAKSLEHDGVEHSWLGNLLEIPQWGIKAIVEPSRGFGNTSHLTPCGRQPSILGWYQLEKRFVSSTALREAMVPRSTGILLRAACLVGLGLVCLIVSVIFIDRDMQRVQELIGRVLGG